MSTPERVSAAIDQGACVARPGTVYLVGAGPGDPGLITVRGRALLGSCDAIVHDALVAGELLRDGGEAGRRPELYFVGKRGGDERSTRQEEINAMLIRLARAGKSVVRLKGGDPFVFGRGSEEALALDAAGVRFEVVPGITAGIAGPAYAGIPVTHRGVSTTVTFVTGNEDPTKGPAQTDWTALARASGTLVLYMGVQRLGEIAGALMRAGLDADTPVAAIEWATTPNQRTIEGTLATIAGHVRAAGLQAPVLTIIGRVVALRPRVRWYDRPEARPLLGQRILVTRPAGQASALSELLRELGANVRELPAVRIAVLDPAPILAALSRLADYQQVVFTSPNAVRITWDALRLLGRDARALTGLTVSAVGPATAATLLERGIVADVTPGRFVAEGLLDALAQHGDIAGQRVLYPAAARARDTVPSGLRDRGAVVDVVPIYESVSDVEGSRAIRAAVASDSIDVVTLASASAARAYADAVGEELVGHVPGVSIGPVTTEAARGAGIRVVGEAIESTIAGLVEAVVAFAAARSGASGSTSLASSASAGGSAGVRVGAHAARQAP
jgi:uroporphyrinogen III methyltransferase / synthase